MKYKTSHKRLAAAREYKRKHRKEIDDFGDERMAVCQWTNDLNGRKTEWHWQHCWYDGGYYGWYERPSHWMPLPEPPAIDAAMEKK